MKWINSNLWNASSRAVSTPIFASNTNYLLEWWIHIDVVLARSVRFTYLCTAQTLKIREWHAALLKNSQETSEHFPGSTNSLENTLGLIAIFMLKFDEIPSELLENFQKMENNGDNHMKNLRICPEISETVTEYIIH